MNKKEYLDELRSKLQGLPKEDLENRIAFYDEAINDRMDEGLTEEEAINEIGPVDDVVKEIAKDTPLASLVMEKVRPTRRMRGWEVVLIVLGFPLWFPLLITGFVLMFVFYLLVWVFAIVTYVIETAFIGGGITSLIVFVMYALGGNIYLFPLGVAMSCFGLAFLFIFACIGMTKANLKLSRKIFTGIKASFIKKGNN